VFKIELKYVRLGQGEGAFLACLEIDFYARLVVEGADNTLTSDAFWCARTEVLHHRPDRLFTFASRPRKCDQSLLVHTEFKIHRDQRIVYGPSFVCCARGVGRIEGTGRHCDLIAADVANPINITPISRLLTSVTSTPIAH